MKKTLALAASIVSMASCIAFAASSIQVIGHRGASGYLPEHTLAAYELAIDQGADYIEPDLVISKDGVLIARHENEISETTDVEKKFPARKTTKKVDGVEVTGWFAEDFTLDEIKTLRAKERLESRDHSNDYKFPVATLDEVLNLAIQKSAEKGRVIGVYPEMKHPTYFRSIDKPLEPALAKVLKKHKMHKHSSPVIIQSFEMTSLEKVHALVKNKLVFLYGDASQKPYDFTVKKDSRTYGDLAKASELRKLKKYLYGIGPSKRLIIPESSSGALQPPTTLVADAHAAGLVVHPYTFRSDAPFLAKEYKGDPVQEYLQFYALGVDGVFSDFPDHAVKARELFKQKGVTK